MLVSAGVVAEGLQDLLIQYLQEKLGFDTKDQVSSQYCLQTCKNMAEQRHILLSGSVFMSFSLNVCMHDWCACSHAACCLLGLWDFFHSRLTSLVLEQSGHCSILTICERAHLCTPGQCTCMALTTACLPA